MSNVRKIFDLIEITSASEDFPLMLARKLEGHMKLASTVSVPSYRAGHSLGLAIGVTPEALGFKVVDLSDGGLVLKEAEIVLKDVPEWSSYVSKSLISLNGKGAGEVESFLQSAFSLAQPSPMQMTAMTMGERIGVRVGNDLELVVGDAPHVLESKEIYCNLAHLALVISPRIAVIMAAEEELRLRKIQQNQGDAVKPLILP